MLKLSARFLIGALFLASSNQAYSAYIGQVAWALFSESPSIVVPADSNGPAKDEPNAIEDGISCYDEGSGDLLDCDYMYSINGVDLGNDPEVAGEISPLTHIEIYGGHEHDFDTHPVYDTFGGTQYPIMVTGGTFTRTGPLSVKGRTGYTWVYTSFNAPETAGSIWTQIDIISPPTYNCVGICFTFSDYREHDTTLVGFFGLQQLPDTGIDYFVFRNSDNAHPQSVSEWGTVYTINQLKNIAGLYHIWSGSLLSINDMSLPEGGLLDIKADKPTSTSPSGTWTIPHRDHRTGNAFDVNHPVDSNGMQVSCNQDYWLKAAIWEQDLHLSGQGNLVTPIQRVCEHGGNIHINAFDPAYPGQIHE